MMKHLLFMAGVIVALVMSSCTKEDALKDGAGVDGYRVNLTLNGSAGMTGTPSATKATEGTVTGSLAALDKEKTVSSLLAVAFYKDGDQAGKLYKVFDVKTEGGFSFDMESAGVFDVWFVANADEALAGLIKGLTPETSTVENLGTLVSTQPSDTGNQFLMVSVDNKVIRTSDGATASVSVTMRRTSARFDIINAIDGITVTGVKFINRATNTQIATPNATADFTTAAFENETYEINLPGNVNATAEDEGAAGARCEAKIYSYENVNDDVEHKPALELTYKVDVTGVEKTHTVAFVDEGGTDLQIKRNYLYRIILNEKHSDMTVASKISVVDWNTAESFVFEELPFEESLNAALKVNMFTQYNVKSIDGKTVTFYEELDNSVPADPKTAYFTWDELQEMNLTKSDGTEILQDAAGNKYRLPTEGELNLLLPMYTEDEQRVDEADGKKGVFQPWWNDNTTTNADNLVIASIVSDEAQGWKETIYLKNKTDNYPDNSMEGSETDGDNVLSGQSWLKRAEGSTSVTYPADGSNIYNVAPVYGLRFQGTSQYAAYRWESCQIADNPLERYLSIKIKALKKDDAITSINDVSQESFWTEGYIEFKFPASGYYAPGANATNPTSENISRRGVYGYCWSSSLWGVGTNARYLGFSLDHAHVGRDVLGRRFPLRLVRVEE